MTRAAIEMPLSTSKVSRKIRAIASASSSSLSASIIDKPCSASLKGELPLGAPSLMAAMRLGQSPVASTGTSDSAMIRRRASICEDGGPSICVHCFISARSIPISSVKFFKEFCGCCGPISFHTLSGKAVLTPGNTIRPPSIRETQRINRADAPSVPVEPATMTG